MEKNTPWSRLDQNMKRDLLDSGRDAAYFSRLSESELIDYWLNWEGIIGYTDGIIRLVRSAYGDQ